MIESKYFCDLCSSEIVNPNTGGMTVCLVAAQGTSDPIELHESSGSLSYRYRDSKRLLVCQSCAGGMTHCWGAGSAFSVGDKLSLIRKMIGKLR